MAAAVATEIGGNEVMTWDIMGTHGYFPAVPIPTSAGMGMGGPEITHGLPMMNTSIGCVARVMDVSEGSK